MNVLYILCFHKKGNKGNSPLSAESATHPAYGGMSTPLDPMLGLIKSI